MSPELDKRLHQAEECGFDSLDLSNLGITEIPKEIIDHSKFTNISSFNLSGNQINELSPLHKLSNIVDLNLSGNQLTDINALQKLNSLSCLNLSSNQLTYLKPVETLVNLNTLNLSGNKVNYLGPLVRLTRLSSLDLSDNQITYASSLQVLTGLTSLSLSSNRVSDVKSLQTLTSLINLELSNTNLTDYDFLQTFHKIRSIDVSENLLIDISFLENLIELEKINLSKNKLSYIRALQSLAKLISIDLSNNRLFELKPLQHLDNLSILNLSSNKINDLRPLQNLKRLTNLNLSNNLLGYIGPLHALTSLTTLNLANNQITDISPISTLIRKDIPVKWEHFHYPDGIFIKDNPLISPSLEVIKQGNKAIILYFKEKEEQGEENLYEAKIVIVGAGESGKTTLIQKIINPIHTVPNLEDKRTEGIRITSLPFVKEIAEGQKKLKAHIWDFGGQELYYTTHQLFLTPDTLYILLNDNRKNDTDFYYWLNIITLRAGEECPILMVFNAKEGAFREIIPGEDLFKAFPNLIKEPIDINFADSDVTVFYHLKNSIQNQFCKLDILDKPYPAYWVQVRDALSNLSEEYLEFKNFTTLCKKYKVSDDIQIRILAQTLHNLGSLLYFPDVFGLEDLIILKSQWCIDAIYAALDIPEINRNGGRFNEAILSIKWSNSRFVGKQLQLLRLMQYFDLCYIIPNTKDYIAPQLLPLQENRYLDFPDNHTIVYLFDYKFMPTGIITKLIARLSNFIKAPYVWRTGVTLEWEEGTIAEVIENSFRRQILIRIAGSEHKRRLREIRKTLYDIHTFFKGLKCVELVTCNCDDCRKDVEPTTFDLNELEDDAQHNDEVTCRNGKRKKIPAQQILDGIAYEDKPRIFISYSHKNEIFKDEFKAMIRPLEREGNWMVWDDRWLLPGDKWNAQILRHLSEANIIILMLTSDFFNSDYIYNIELSKSIQRHDSGDALVIGVVVSDCMWEETPLSKIQIIPKDGLPVERHTNRNEVWKVIAVKIKETISTRNKQSKRKGGWHI